MFADRSRLLKAALVTFVAVALVAAAVAPAVTTRATPRKITGSGVGTVKLGKTYTALRRARAVGRITRGCELEGPNARQAPLRAPLKGFVDFSQSSPRRVTNIAIRGGATARGVGIGASQARVKRAFPKVRFDRSKEARFDVIIGKVSRSAGGPFEFAIVSMTKTVTAIGIPKITFCE
jgi:hypothetical protein